MTLSNLGPVVLVGAGKMGTAMARGWLAAGLRSADLILVDPKPSDAVADFAGQHGLLLVAAIPADIVPAVIMLAVKPQVMKGVLETVKPNIGAETLVMSVAAGIGIDMLQAALGTARIVRTMPNTPAQVGKGITGAVAGSGVSARDREIAAELLQASGEMVWLDMEADLDALTAISGCGPAYVFLLVETMAAAGVAEGLPEDQAMRLARQTVIGAAALMEADSSKAATLRENVTSPGGVTAEALRVLMNDADGLPQLMRRAVAAARKRNAELGQ